MAYHGTNKPLQFVLTLETTLQQLRNGLFFFASQPGLKIPSNYIHIIITKEWTNVIGGGYNNNAYQILQDYLISRIGKTKVKGDNWGQ